MHTISLDAVDLDSLPNKITVQSSYKLNLPRHLLIHAANIKLMEPIGQGDEMQVTIVLFNIHRDVYTVGEFGIVYKGYIVKEQGRIMTDTVAVKTLKGNVQLLFY